MNIAKLKHAPVALGLAAVAAAAMLATPLLSNAQSPPAPAAEQVEAPSNVAELQQLQIEFLTVRKALAEAEEKALADPALQTKHEELQTAIQEAMRAAEPETEARIARLSELEQALAAGQQAEAPDEAALQALLAEAQELQRKLVDTQQQVVAAEPLASQIASMRTEMLDKMTAIDPEVPEHLERIEVLAKSLP